MESRGLNREGKGAAGTAVGSGRAAGSHGCMRASTNNSGRISDHINGFCWIDLGIRETRGKQVLVNKENRSKVFLMLSIFFSKPEGSL